MKLVFTLFIFCIFTFSLYAQNFNGQWKGSFVDNSTNVFGAISEKVDYVLELECHGTEVSGYSYTYFIEGGKRYYTICKLKGSLNKATKELTVTEVERTKYNTPPDITNYFQMHKLKYVKENSDTESLQGTWVAAPNQTGNAGYGRTLLTRRIIKNTLFKKPENNVAVAKKDPTLININRQNPVAKHSNPVTKTPNKNSPTHTISPQVKNDNTVKKSIPQKIDTVARKELPVSKPIIKEPEVISKLKFEKRVNSVLKTIEIKNEKFTVDFYDNGEIDGDTISVFFNGKLVLSHRMLTDKPITLSLTADPSREINELVMYAENLGSIPPNTALMIVHDGDNRYETRIESDLGKNGTIRFTYKPKEAP